MDRKDFDVVANSRGYQVQYKGKNIGGAGIDADAKAPRGKAAWKQTEDNLKYGSMAIQDILAGNGRKDMLEAIASIEGENAEPVKVQNWSVRFFLDYRIEAMSRDEAEEKAKQQFIEELQNNTKVAIPDLFQVAVLQNINKGG